MVPRELIDTAPVPGGREPLRLFRRGAEFSIMLGGNELMNSRMSGSEEALARLTSAAMGPRPDPAVLIGGLGMGFTLRAALAELGGGARVTVAELVPAVIAWARGPMAAVFGDGLADPRLTIVAGDVGEHIRAGGWDAILLDVDNGPDGLTRPGNDWLYGEAGLRATYRGLRAGGVLAVWSSAADRRFTARLRTAGFAVEEVAVRATALGKGARHVVWVARRGAAEGVG